MHRRVVGALRSAGEWPGWPHKQPQNGRSGGATVGPVFGPFDPLGDLKRQQQHSIMTHTYDIVGMHCQNCVGRITAALTAVAGVASAAVTLKPPRATVQMTKHISTNELTEALRSAGDYRLTEAVGVMSTDHAAPTSTTDDISTEAEASETLWPLLLIVAYIAGTVTVIALATRDWSAHTLMNHFMGGFFLVFSFFKFLDLRGFADAYRSYDVVAKKLPAWGWTYPFVELALGIAYVLNFQPVFVNFFTLVLMLVSSIGVLKTLLDKRTIRCACLGTVLKLPMTKVTLVEDLGMAAMAAAMLILLFNS